MLLYEKISYSSSFSAYNLKLSIDLGATIPSTVKFAQWNLFRANIGDHCYLFVKLGIENERETGLVKRKGNELLIKCPVVLALEY